MKQRLYSIVSGIFFTTAILASTVAPASGQIYSYMPDESAPHEGTWLQWPHHYTYGVQFRREIESSWVAMTRVLVQSGRVHIVAYNNNEVRQTDHR